MTIILREDVHISLTNKITQFDRCAIIWHPWRKPSLDWNYGLYWYLIFDIAFHFAFVFMSVLAFDVFLQNTNHFTKYELQCEFKKHKSINFLLYSYMNGLYCNIYFWILVNEHKTVQSHVIWHFKTIDFIHLILILHVAISHAIEFNLKSN